MCRARLRQRAPSASFLANGYLPRFSLRFHKRSRDGSAKADAYFTGNRHDRVWGVLFEVNLHDKTTLDACEFLGVGYDDHEVEIVVGARRRTSAHIYIARRQAIDRGLRPYCWYHRFCLVGAREHGLPGDYLRGLRQVRSIIDPDRERLRRNLRLLTGEPIEPIRRSAFSCPRGE